MDEPRKVALGEWEFVDLSFGCHRHDKAMCLKLRHKITGEELHIPSPDEQDEEN